MAPKTKTVVLFNQPVAPESLVTPSGGQAEITSTTGNFTSLQTQLQNTNLFFTEFEANPNFATSDQIITVRVIETNNQINNFTFTSKDSGQNFFSVRAINNQQIRSVAVISPTESIEDVSQIRIDGITAVPEASSLALMGIVVTTAAAGGLFRRARKVIA